MLAPQSFGVGRSRVGGKLGRRVVTLRESRVNKEPTVLSLALPSTRAFDSSRAPGESARVFMLKPPGSPEVSDANR